MSSIDLSKANRQSPKGLVLLFAQSVRRFIRAFWPLLLVYVFRNQKFQDHQNEILMGAALLGVLLIVHAVLSYLNFKFHVTEDSFVLNKGYIRKQQLNIPLERIQTVNYKASVLQRLLKVVSLEIDTAGSAKKELNIHALDLGFADALKERLTEQSTAEAEVEEAVEQVLNDAKETKSKFKFQLSLPELIKIGFLQNHLRMALIIVAFGWQFYNELADAFKEEAAQITGQMSDQLLQSSLVLLIFMGILFFIISVLASVIQVVIRFFDFQFSKNDSSFQMQAGLLNRKNMIIPFRKIQELTWSTNPLKKAFSLYSIKIKQASSQENKKGQFMEVPGCEMDRLNSLRDLLFEENEFVNEKVYPISKSYLWRIFFFMGIIPLVVSSPFYIFEIVPYFVIFLWLGFSSLGAFLAIKKRYFRISENQIIVSEGMFGQDWKQISLFKVQVVDFKQSIFQKRAGLASIRIHTASGNVTIPFISESLAKELHTYLIYKIQESNKSWM